jgi:hypothetical protein
MTRRPVLIDDATGGLVTAVSGMCRLHTSYTLANSGAAQQLFNSSTNGRITLPIGVYRFESLYSISGMSSTSGNSSFSLAGGATLANVLMYTVGIDGTAAAAAAQTGSMAVTAAFPSSQHVGSILTTQQSFIAGSFEVTVAGTVIPSITLLTAIGTAVVAAGAFFEIWQTAQAAATVTVGAWD